MARASLIVGVVAISFAAIFFREAAPTHPLASAALRLGLSAVLLGPFAAHALRVRRLTPVHLRAAVLCGLAYAVHFGAWVSSLTMTSVAASVTIVTATPLLLIVSQLFTGKERPKRRQWLSLGFGVLGLALIQGDPSASGPGGESPLLGNLLALLGCAGMAFYLSLVRPLRDLPVLGFSAVVCAVASTLLFCIGWAAEIPMTPASPRAAVALVLAAAIPQLIGHSALTWSLRHLTPVTVGLATLGEPLGSTLWAYLWLDEAPGPYTLAGAPLTLFALSLALAGSPRPAQEDAAD